MHGTNNPAYRLSSTHVSRLSLTAVVHLPQAYALNSLEDRGEMFVKPGDEVYEGMIVGEHSRPTDIEINPTKEKKLTNMRAAGTDENVKLSPIRQMSLEDVVTYIGEDEMIDVSPTKIRMRKRELTANERKRVQGKRK